MSDPASDLAGQLSEPAAHGHPSAATASATDTPIHIFNGFQNPTGGSELEALSLHGLLRREPARRIHIAVSRPNEIFRF